MNFAMAEESVSESENNLTICLQVNAEPFTSQRNVSINIHTVDKVQNNDGEL